MANKLSQERIDMLNEINFVWSMRNKRASPASAKATTPPPAKRQRRGSTSSTAAIVSVEEEPVPIKSKKKQQQKDKEDHIEVGDEIVEVCERERVLLDVCSPF